MSDTQLIFTGGSLTIEILDDAARDMITRSQAVFDMSRFFKDLYFNGYPHYPPKRPRLHPNDQVAVDFLDAAAKLGLTKEEDTDKVAWAAKNLWLSSVRKRKLNIKYKGPVRSHNASKIY